VFVARVTLAVTIAVTLTRTLTTDAATSGQHAKPSQKKPYQDSNGANDPGKKKCKDKQGGWPLRKWAIIATLLTQKAAGNALESGFKPTVWSFVVQAVAGATMDGSRRMSCNVRLVITT